MQKLFLLTLLCGTISTYAQISAQLIQHPDVSTTHIAFSYGDDLYIVEKSGGTAHQLTSPAGPELYPRFSPDGKQIAFTANYNGNSDVYVMPVSGGIPKRLTWNGLPDQVRGWTPDGKSILFTSLRESGKERFSQFYTVSAEGGTPQKLPVPYGEFGSYSADGKNFAYTDKSRVNRNWKRYRGGTAPDILVFNLETYKTENITNNAANDEIPMWMGNAIYYMSDNGPAKRNNLWKYDLSAKTNTQITKFTDFDITFPSNSANEIVFEAGGKLYLYTVGGEAKEIQVQVVTDQRALIPVRKSVASNIASASLAPDGSRVTVEARGDIFDLPASEGFISNLSNTSGNAERYPAWSPDGKHLAYWSDESGEYQLKLRNQETGSSTTITAFKTGFYYNIYWSPDSKNLVTINQAMQVLLIHAGTGAVKVADQGKFMFEGNLRGFEVNWSPDSRYFVYSMAKENRVTSALYIYDTQVSKAAKLTSGFYSDNAPVFSSDGKYIYYTTNRSFRPVYSDVDNTFIYPNTTGIAVGTVNASIPSLISLKNDEPEIKKEETPEDDKKSKKKKKSKNKKDSASAEEKKGEVVEIAGFENRIEMLDIDYGNINSLAMTNGKLLYMRYPNSGSPRSEKPSLELFDPKKKESKTVIGGVNGFEISADGKKLLVSMNGKLAVIDPSPGQKPKEMVPTQDLAMNVVPKEEWKQIFNDVWRFERDYFYDPNMHGVDWNLMRERYGALVDQASSRNDVNIIIGDLIAELNASHTYTGGGDSDRPENINVGYLGADIVMENGAFRVKKVIEGAPWDVEVRSPLSKPGVNVVAGDYILEINGQKPDVNKSIYAALQGLAGKTVQLTVNKSPNLNGSRKVLIEPLRSEMRLRNLAWINNFRKRVEEATNGRIGYVFVPSTGIGGQNELFRQFYGQMNKEGFIIDERFNNGGQIPDRFVELLDRGPLAFWAVRDGKDWGWPPSGNFGPKVMLINGFSGSGGDAFPDYFRKRGIGPLIGTRTWGGLIGISGAPSLIDGGRITVPTFRMYDPDGEWFKEGYGVDPDIEVVEDFEKLANGTDAQLEAAIKEVMRLLESSDKFNQPNRPQYEKRN